LESRTVTGFERWNSYSRIRATEPRVMPPLLWGPSPTMPSHLRTPQALLNIDGEAGTVMHRYDGTRESIDFLRYDIVNLAYRLPNLKKSAVIGVGGGRDILSAHLFGVEDITGVELNPIFVHLHTEDPYYSNYSGLKKLSKLNLQIDDARSWFAGTKERFDLIQMSMIDTWAATGAGAFSLSENGLYTLEGWRAFLQALQPGGFFTVARWYNPSDVNETGRMIGLATAVLLDSGVRAPREHMVAFNSGRIATLIVAKQAFTAEQLAILKAEARTLGFAVLLSPDVLPKSPVLAAMVTSTTAAALDAAASSSALDLTPPTDSRPFFFNQLRFSQIGEVTREILNNREFAGVLKGNLQASAALLLIFVIALIAVILVIVLPLRAAAKTAPKGLLAAGTSYFALIGMGFMLAEIALLQHFSIYLGHPIYSLGVCLFSLILATGLGSLASERWPLTTKGRFTAWALLVAALLLVLQQGLLDLLHATTAAPLVERIAVAVAVLMPVGLLLGFAFPTGITLVQRRSQEPTPWFWGINGATGVMASVLAIMLSMALGIDQTILIAALCYLLLLPAGLALIRQAEE
jgi:spermidine synthase